MEERTSWLKHTSWLVLGEWEFLSATLRAASSHGRDMTFSSSKCHSARGGGLRPGAAQVTAAGGVPGGARLLDSGECSSTMNLQAACRHARGHRFSFAPFQVSGCSGRMGRRPPRGRTQAASPPAWGPFPDPRLNEWDSSCPPACPQAPGWSLSRRRLALLTRPFCPSLENTAISKLS